MAYMPRNIAELRTPVKLLIPTHSRKNGVTVKTYPTDGDTIVVNWKSYGGTESVVDGLYCVIDTATVTTRYRPDITSECRLLREDGAVYEIKNEPEDIELRHKYMQFKVERVKGGA